MDQSKVIKEGAILIGVYLVLLLLSLLVPLFIVVGILLLPVPFVIFSSKYDWQRSLLLLGVAVLLSLFFATNISLPMTMLAGSGGIMLGVSIHHNLSAYETWARGTIGFISGLLFVFLFGQLVLQINWITEFDGIVKESLQTSKGLMDQFGLGDQAEEQMGVLEEQMLLMTNLIPAGIAIISILLAFLSQWISYKFINQLNDKQLKFPPFRTLQFPVAIVWIYFFALIFSFIDLEPNTIYLVIHNVMTITGLFMVLQGLSFAFYYAHHKQRSNLLPTLLVGLTILLPFFFLYLVRILGIIDIGFRLRDRLSNENK